MLPDTLATVVGIRRILLKAALVLVLILAAVLASPAIYRAAKIYRYNSLAEAARQQGDLQKSLFYAHNVRNLDPNNEKAIGVIARISTESNQPSALLWLARWTELNPKDPVRLSALGKLALLRDQIPVAEVCLKNLKKLPQASPVEVMELESALLVRTGKTREALELLKQAASSPETNPQLALNYGILLLSQPQKSQQQEGITLLQTLSSKPGLTFAASNNLIRYAFDKRDKDLARQAAATLSQKPDLSIQEYLLTMKVELFVNGKLPDSFQQEILLRLNKTPRSISLVINWLLNHRQSKAADNLISTYKNNGKAPDVIKRLDAFRMADRGEWEKLLETLQNPDWKDLGSMRYVLLIQACRVLNKPELEGLKKRLEETLVLELRRSPQSVFEIDKLALQWRWKEERLLVWNAVGEQDSFSPDHLKAELTSAENKRDTLLLYGLAQILSNRFPEHKALRNNVITYALLLNVSPDQQLGKAKGLVEKNPGDTSFKTTYALALIKNGRPEEALTQYDGFTEAELQKPEMSAYYAMALLANGQKEKAAPYLVLARKASLLPEEETLLRIISDR